MTWADFYLLCFLVGFILSAASFLMGSAHVHLPHGHGGAHAHVGHGHGHGHGVGHDQGHHLSFLNFGTFAAFLAWFGGAGFLLARYSSVWIWLGLGIAILSGLTGAAMVFWFVGKVLIASERDLDPADYDPIGALGRVSSTIRPDGAGEMIYSQQGTRRSVAARSDNGQAISKGTEVVITRYEKGIAYVRRWDELAGQQE
jgi:membrane protein implicated in regulation of membrane protease activity